MVQRFFFIFSNFCVCAMSNEDGQCAVGLNIGQLKWQQISANADDKNEDDSDDMWHDHFGQNLQQYVKRMDRC